MDDTLRALMRLYRSRQDDATAHALARAVTRGSAESGLGIVSIPTIGSRLTLAEPWAFVLVGERRNTDFWNKVHGKPTTAEVTERWTGEYYDKTQPGGEDGQRYPRVYATKETSLPAGTVLRVDRIYIKQGGENFDSVTFRVEKMPGDDAKPKHEPFKKKGSARSVGRFWAKLHDANRIVCEWDEATVPRQASESRAAAT